MKLRENNEDESDLPKKKQSSSGSDGSLELKVIKNEKQTRNWNKKKTILSIENE